MEFSEFIRQPFKVEAVQVTDENMEELCKLIGLEIKSTKGSRYILVDRRIVPLGTKAFVGSWVTRMGPKLRCYPNHIFVKQFLPMTDEWAGWFTDEEEDEQGSLQETVEILNDDEAMAAIAEAEAEEVTDGVDSTGTSDEVTGRNGEEDGTAPVSTAHADPVKPQIGDVFTEDTVEPYTS